jgi:hypothetical protein
VCRPSVRFLRSPVATASELLAAVNVAILQLLQDNAMEVEVNGQRYRSQDLDKLRLLRKELKFEAIEEATTPVGGRRGPIIQGFR